MCSGQNRSLHWSNHYAVRPAGRAVDDTRLRTLLARAEELSGQSGMTTHEAQDFFRANGRAAAARRLHIVLRRMAQRSRGTSAQAFAVLPHPAAAAHR